MSDKEDEKRFKPPSKPLTKQEQREKQVAEERARQKQLNLQKDKKFNKIRSKIVGTIREYEDMLERTNDPT